MSNSGFSNLNKYVEDIMKLLIGSDKIVRLLSDVEPDMYSDRKRPMANPKELLDDRSGKILHRNYIPNIEDKVESYITLHLGNFLPSHAGNYLRTSIVFNVFTHEQLLKTNYGDRLLLMCDELNSIIDGQRLAVGKLMFRRGDVIQTLKRPYLGHWFIYELVDFN